MLISIEQFIDAVYVINLESAKNCFKQFQRDYQNFNHPNLIRFEAVDGKTVKIDNWKGNIGSLGCRQSHLNLLKTAKEKGHQSFIVFEDDAVIPKNFRNKLIDLFKYIPTDWDMVYLYAENHFIKPTSVNEHVNKLNNTLGLVAILYHGKCLDIVINKIENDLRWIDSSLADLHSQLNVYAPKKSIVGHYDGYSFIEQKHMRYRKNFINYVLQKVNNLIHRIEKIGK